ncbi:MAG: pyruvate, water dikinase [Burkholderiales bacterium]|nr:pyruvate, water dikinase [Burkholderiales bacterium]
MSALLKTWDAICAAGQKAVGGKAWNLARLSHYGFPVPDGLLIPVAAYRTWLAETGVSHELMAATELTSADRRAVLAMLQQTLRATPPNAALVDALRQSLSTWLIRTVAVRSSAPQEDSAHASFAGIHASYLNVQGENALLDAVVAVWASVWTDAAVAYRERLNIAHEEAAMAVLIMPQLQAVSSGIGFTCDPLTGRDDRLVIHANWGLGESLVGGLAEGDEIVLAESLVDDRLSIFSHKLGSKAVNVYPAAGGGTETIVPATDKAHTKVMPDEDALALGELLRQAALALNLARPNFDCEWVWDGRQFWLLQARPITAQARLTYPALHGQPDIWSRGNTRDVVPDPLSPIDWSSSRRLVNCLLEEGYKLSGFALQAGVQRGGLFHGRLYLNMSLIQWEGYAAFAVEPEAMNRLVGGHQPEIHVPAFTFRQKLARTARMGRFMLRASGKRKQGNSEVSIAAEVARQWRQTTLPGDDKQIAATLRKQLKHLRTQHGLHFLQGSGGASLSILVDLINAHLPGEGHALASALMAGGEASVTAQQSYELIGIARTAMADPVTRAWLETRRQTARDWRSLPSTNPFRMAFSVFIEKYGHRGVYESYLRNPRWHEDAGYLLDSLPSLAVTDLAALAARQQQSVANAKAQALKALPWWKHGLFAMLMRAAKVETNGREAARSALMAYTAAIRQLLLALGAKWAALGWLTTAEDIFLLHECEILAVLDHSRPGTALPALTTARKSLFESWLSTDAPDVILEGGSGDLATEPDIVSDTDGVTFNGVPVGTGIATGTVRLLQTPADGWRLNQGDIMVVPSTDPAWTPLFLKAGGLVMETGGFLSHGAIVAREFGIPAVVNLPHVMTQLRDGETVTVNGPAGTVIRQRTSQQSVTATSFESGKVDEIAANMR